MTVTLYALVMVFAALVTAIGLVLLFSKHAPQPLSKIRVAGQEFQFSAPGLVVALAGCALFILLPVIQLNDRNVVELGSHPDGILHDDNVVVPGEEHEPNGNFDTANVIKIGTATKGVITTRDDRDFVKLQIPKTLTGLPRVRVIVEKTFSAAVTVYDENEQRVGDNIGLGKDPVSFSFEGTPGAYYYIVVDSFNNEHGEYTLVVKQDKQHARTSTSFPTTARETRNGQPAASTAQSSLLL